MLQYVTERLQQVSSEPLGLVLALLLGVVSAASSACCTLPALGLIVGFSGAEASDTRKSAAKSAVFFTLGIIVSLMILGAVSGFVGQAAQSILGRYWKIPAGVVAVLLGLASLKLLPFDLSLGTIGSTGKKLGRLGPVLAGLILGAIVAMSSLPCNPGIFIVIGAAILQGAVLWASLLLGMFAVGFAIPLGAVILGVSLGRVSLAARGMDTAIRWLAGGVLVAVGFYFLVTS
ncbi:MAG: cytochrome c biogenesis protein CcdA [Candidatus Brocadiia bacterium]